MRKRTNTLKQLQKGKSPPKSPAKEVTTGFIQDILGKMEARLESNIVAKIGTGKQLQTMKAGLKQELSHFETAWKEMKDEIQGINYKLKFQG